jgi:eukaryotic-like serine/threonine-protein kinase
MDSARARRRRIEAVCDAALDREAGERAAFVSAACGDDDELRQEVEALLAHAQTAEGFLAAPMGAVAAHVLGEATGALLVGQQVGSYQILSRLGAGGMGEVYRARDPKLRRDVAIKILPRVFTSDPERLARFEREARMLAAVNHPHIGAIYGVEEADGLRALVLELVEGETLAKRLQRGSMPVAEALTMARQIADALDAAHEKGIVHRDLKPANIKITPDGTVKVLDFGLAKAIRPDGLDGEASNAPTMTIGDTREGVIVGTVAYMSPEQARGQTVDKRSDIWAFGCVVYEMLTGQPTFAGETISDTIAAILEHEPDWRALPATTPTNGGRLLQRCLEKDPKRRLRDIGDARVELDDAMASPRHFTELRKALPAWIWGVASALVVLGLGLGWTIAHLRQPDAEIRTLRLTVDPPAGTEFRPDSGAAISPDGRLLAFVTGSPGGVKLWIRPLNSLAARELPGTDAAGFPFWSPDSRSLGFFAAGKLKRVEVGGGLPTVICDVGEGRGGAWNEDGVILFNAVNDGPLLRVSASGGMPVPFTTIDPAQQENSHRFPQFLPGGRQFLYFVRSENSGVYLGSLDRPHEKFRLLNSLTNAVFAADGNQQSGHLFWARDGALMAQPFDPQKKLLMGEAITVAEAGGDTATSGLAAVSVSNDGTLFYGGAETGRYQLTWYGRDGDPLGILGQPEHYRGLRISPDGKRLALSRDGEVWQMELARGVSTRVTFSGRGANGAVWSPDSQRIAYTQGAPPNVFSANANGTGTEERLIETRDTLVMEDWSPNGKFLLYLLLSNDISSRAQPDLWVSPMATGHKPAPFLTTPFREGPGQFSPDGKWIAYTSDESGRNEVYVQGFPASGSKWQVSSKGGDWVRWRKDGEELFYVAPDRTVMSVVLLPASSFLEFGTPSGLFALPATFDVNNAYPYDVMPDGQRFLALTPATDAEQPPMTVIVNWRAELSSGQK